MRLVMILCFLGLALVIQGSTAPSPSTLDVDSLIQVPPGPVGAPSLAFEPNVNFDNTGSPVLPPSPRIFGKGIGIPVAAPANERRDPIPPVNNSPPQDPYISPTSSPTPSIVGKRGEMPAAAPPISTLGAKPPTSHSPTKEPHMSSVFTPPPSVVPERDGMPVAAPRSVRPEPVSPVDQSPIREPAWSPLPTPPPAPIPVAKPPTERLKPLRPVNHHPEPSISPASNPPTSVTWKKGAMPVAAPPGKIFEPLQPADSSPMKEPNISPASTPLPSINWKRDKNHVATPPSRRSDPEQPANSFPIKAPSGSTWKGDAMPVAAPPSKRLEPPQSVSRYPSIAPSPSTLDVNSSIHIPQGPVSAPISALEPNVNFNNTGNPALPPSPSIVMKGTGTPVAAPSIEWRDPIPPVNDSTPQDPHISPTSAPTPSIIGKREGVASAAPPISIPGAKSPTIQNPDIPSAFTPPPSIVSERDGKPAAAPRNERPEPVRQADRFPIREPAWSPLPTPPSAPIPVAVSPTKRIEPLRPVNYHPEPGISSAPNPPPSITWKTGAMPVAAPPNKRPEPLRPAHSSPIKEPDISPASTPPPSINWKGYKIPVAAPSYGRLDPQRPANTSPIKGAGISPASNIPPSIMGRRHVMPSDAPASLGLEPVQPTHHSPTNDPYVSPASTPSPTIGQKRDVLPDAGSPNIHPKPLTPTNHPPKKGSLPAVAPSSQKSPKYHVIAPASYLHFPDRPSNERHHFSASPPSIPFYKHHYTRNNNTTAPALSHGVPPASIRPDADPVISPTALPKTRRKHYAPAPLQPVPFHQPKGNPSGSLSRTPKPLPAVRALPPPPPNADCSSTTCTEPYTNSPPGSPCACVFPIQVGLRLGVDLYTFFPLVSELAVEVSAGVFMKQSQVRIMGANTASQQLEKTVVLIDLVPLREKFDGTTAFLTFERFWHKQVPIKASVFGNYEVLYVRYPGLPPSPPMAPSDITIVDGGPYSGNNGRSNKPLGVDVQKRNRKNGLGGGVIAIIVLSTTVAVILLSAAAWIFLFKQRADHVSQSAESPRALPSLTKSSAALGSLIGSGLGSASLSNVSSIAPYTGSAKTLSTSDIEKATDNYNPSRILGEGGFGLVYRGVLEDGTEVAVKVLKRDDQQGSREFLAEIEMLSRLHHRNLVKLIGICIEERARCLVYELIRNGSVESHLHGVDKESSPLDWAARMKIALGAARGLAYLHEDSSPRVIHRDFKASNILLEDDFTPKVSDFGLARTAMDEENRHISTRVMGTFGYVAPEYAMTGHLLVKSDVYSYGVVLLELLTGKKPIDMSQAPGQENVVAWARPLLTSKEGLEAIIDPALGPDVPFDSISKVAAIASMCVQPEVSNRPFMGEVVQALKLVCNECEEAYEVGSRTFEGEELSVDMGASMSPSSERFSEHLHRQFSHSTFERGFDPEHGLSVSDLSSTSARLGGREPRSFRRNSSLGPVRTGGSWQFWQRVRRLYGGSASEHVTSF